jgi:hypothetical protein
MPKDCQYLNVRLEVEYEKLRTWGDIAFGSAASDGNSSRAEVTVSASIRSSRLPLVAILTEVQTIMQAFAKVNGGYIELQHASNESRTDTSETGNLLSVDGLDIIESFDNVASPYPPKAPKPGQKVSKSSKDKKVVSGFRKKRLRWVIFSKDKFVELLDRLEHLNKCLKELLDDHQISRVEKTTQDIYLEMLQARNEISDLEDLVRAMSTSFENYRQNSDSISVASTLVNNPDASIADSDELSLAHLADFKLRYETLKRNGTETSSSIVLSEIKDLPERLEAGRTNARWKASGKNVWIEWRDYKTDVTEDGLLDPKPEILKLVQEMALLLKAEKPDEFGIPPCLGYVDTRGPDQAKGLLGFVFTNPLDVKASERPVSILDAIVDGERSKPSLTARFALAHKIATCLMYLHSVNWLHKGIRSENIIYFNHEGNYNIDKPCLTGFEYSRPARPGQGTVALPRNPRWDIYQYPDIQTDGKRPLHRKTFDIYSFGLVLLEIAHWQPIEKIMKIEEIATVGLDTTRAVRERLLRTEPTILDVTTRAIVGDRFCEVVRTCIGGRESFEIDGHDDELSEQTAVLIQHRFQQDVVEKLKSLVV